jgi:putative hemolysin
MTISAATVAHPEAQPAVQAVRLPLELASAAAPNALRSSGLEVQWARHQDDVRAAQRLRYEVFAGEMGARLNTQLPDHDIDLFDNFCEHLLVREKASGHVVGTYRVLTPAQAKRVGSFYSDTEFDLTRLRSCGSAWSSSGAAACIGTIATAASSWRSGVLWLNSWCATSSTL